MSEDDTKKENPEQPGGVDGGGTPVVPRPETKVNRKIMDAITQINSLKAERKEINSKISAIIEGLEADGINRHAFRYTMHYLSLAEDKREGLDLSYVLCRTACGAPVQMDWIEESNGSEHGATSSSGNSGGGGVDNDDVVAALRTASTKREAAQKLGISERTLRRRISRMMEQGISVPMQ